MTWGIVFFLAALQGVGEFVPISSSGHLRIAEVVLGVGDTPKLFDVMLHIGTLVAVLLVYRVLIMRLATALVRGLGHPIASYRDAPDFRTACHVFLAMIPTTAMVLILESIALTWDVDIARVGATLCVTATMLFALQLRIAARNRAANAAGQASGAAVPRAPGRPLEELTWKDALVIGTAQGFSATFRGLSRSGSTITAGVFTGLSQEAAAAFSFLLSIPAVLGALVFELKDAPAGSAGAPNLVVFGLVGAVAAAVIGYFALRFLLAMLRRGRIYLFAGWCLAVGLFAIAWRFGVFGG